MNQNTLIASRDGTTIGYRTLGRGPALVVVHGTMRSADDYTKLAGYLGDTFTVHVVDRRGRGMSGPQGPAYSLQKESEDITAVLQHTGATLLFGHSFGGAVALESALTYPPTRLALYEPAISIDNDISDESLRDLASAINARDFGKALTTIFKLVGESEQLPLFLRVAFAIPLVERAMFASPVGKRIRTLLETTVAEARVTKDADATYQKYGAITADALIMHGTESPAWLLRAVTCLARTLPHARTLALDGLGHSAPCEDAPKEVASQLKAFLVTA